MDRQNQLLRGKYAGISAPKKEKVKRDELELMLQEFKNQGGQIVKLTEIDLADRAEERRQKSRGWNRYPFKGGQWNK